MVATLAGGVTTGVSMGVALGVLGTSQTRKLVATPAAICCHVTCGYCVTNSSAVPIIETMALVAYVQLILILQHLPNKHYALPLVDQSLCQSLEVHLDRWAVAH